MTQKSAALDKIGLTSSMICAVHCAIMPLVIAAMPAIGVGFFTSHQFEWGLFAFTALLGTASMHFGRRRHRSAWPILSLGIGLSLIAAGLIGHDSPVRVLSVCALVGGGLFVATSHFFNKKLCDSCPKCHERG